ncbi:MAG TPA: phage tail sheath subtilisin-like domain-containing protein [Longimicrobiales bacterium]
MAETFTLSELVVPGTYVRVSAEGLIGAAAISTGNIGMVGTAATADGETHLLGDFASARAGFGASDGYQNGAGTLNLTRGLELAYRNGARSVYAQGLPAGADQADFAAAFDEVIKDDVNILIAPELSTADALAVLGPALETAENAGRDMIAVVGTDATTTAAMLAQVPTNDRIVFTAPGIMAFDPVAQDVVALSGTYAAAAVAGLLSTLSPQQSPTNKVLPGVVRLARRFSYAESIQLLNGRIAVLEQRGGVRVVRGLTTDDGAFRQVTTRRITDFAKAGMRKASDPFIGRLNNQRVRKALYGAIDGFLTTMLQDEQLTGYNLEVTATRQDEIAGRAQVNAVLRPTFSIDFVAVTMVLE